MTYPKYLLVLLMLLFVCSLKSQTVFTVTDGNATGIDIPIDNYYTYSYSEQLYLQSEINTSGDIVSLEFEYNGNQAFTDAIKIYMGHTTKSSFSSTSDWVTSSGMTLVYDGNISVTASAGWVSITLDNAFNYNNTDNLVIAVDENTGTYHSSSSHFYALGTGYGTSRSNVYSNDYINPNPASPPSGYVQNYVPSLKLGISTGPSLTASSNQLNDFNYCDGNGPSSAQTFTVSGNQLTDDVTVSCGANYQISLDGVSYSNSLLIAKDNAGSASSTVYVRLLAGLNSGTYYDQIDINSNGMPLVPVLLDGFVVPTTAYVSNAGNDITGDGSQGNPFATIDYALNIVQAASCGPASVYLMAGTYPSSNMSISSDNVTIQGDVYGNTILDGVDNLSRCFKITGTNVLLSNLTIQNYGLDYSTCSTSGACGGGAIEIGDGSSSMTASFNQVVFKNNINDGLSGDGGAVYVNYAADVLFSKCTFAENAVGDPSSSGSNTTNNGGAVYIEGESEFENCVFYRNISKGYGSAVFVEGFNAEADFYHCTASNNNARGNYGALAVRSGFINVYNSVIYGNLFSTNSLGNDFYESSGLLNVSYCIYSDDYFNRSSISNSQIIDPIFNNIASDDYSLQTGSPAIDAGLSSYASTDDINGLSRPQGAGVDMGAYEFSTCAAPLVNYTVVENCASGTFTIDFTVSSYGDGTSADISDGSFTINNAVLNSNYSFGPYSVGTTVTLYYNGLSYGGCDATSPALSGCVPNTCADAIDLAGGSMVADFSVADNDASETDFGGEPNYLQVGNGTTISNCNGGAVHSAYDYTEYKDLWYKVVVPAGDDEFTLTFSNVNGHYVVVPYYGTCGSLTQMRLLYNTDQSITGVIDNDGNNWFGDDPFVTPSITTLDFKGDEILNAPGGVVYLRMFPYDGGQGGSSGCIASNFSTAALTVSSSITPAATRTTVSNGNWSDPSIWDCNCTPSSPENVVVNHLVDVNAATTVDGDLTVSSTGLITVLNTNILELNGVLDNTGAIFGTISFGGATSRYIKLGEVDNVEMNTTGTIELSNDATIYKRLTLTSGTFNTGSFKLTLNSDASTTALIDDKGGLFVGTISAERFVQNTTGHHFLSAPVYSPTVGQINDDIPLDLAAAPFPNIYYYDETDPSLDYEVGWVAPTSLSHTMNEGEGYTVYFNAFAGITLDIEGVPITGSLSRGLTYTAGSNPPNNATSPQGWNFVGNPYPSPIDFDLLMSGASNSIQRGYYTWDPVTKSYNSYVGGISSPSSFTKNIHSMQGFWVRVDAAATLNFNNSCRINDPSVMTTPFLKSSPLTMPIVRLSMVGLTSTCETVVVLRDQATKNFDSDYDAHFLKSEQANRVDLASDVNGSMIRINALPNDLSKNISIPLTNKVSLDSNYSIKINEFENFPAHAELYLEDKELNIFYPIGTDAYLFNGSPSDRSDRFVLHIVVDGTINTEQIAQEDQFLVDVFRCSDNLCLDIEKAILHDFDLLMYDKNGRLVVQKTLDAGLNQYSLNGLDNLNTDIYVVSIPEIGFCKTIKW